MAASEWTQQCRKQLEMKPLGWQVAVIPWNARWRYDDIGQLFITDADGKPLGCFPCGEYQVTETDNPFWLNLLRIGPFKMLLQ
jgi:hypothetical protein